MLYFIEFCLDSLMVVIYIYRYKRTLLLKGMVWWGDQTFHHEDREGVGIGPCSNTKMSASLLWLPCFPHGLFVFCLIFSNIINCHMCTYNFSLVLTFKKMGSKSSASISCCLYPISRCCYEHFLIFFLMFLKMYFSCFLY